MKHTYMKGHTRTVITMRKEINISKSLKQKLNTIISTEQEVAAGDDIIPDILWTGFVFAQGHGSFKIVMYQDNMSAILLEQNWIFQSEK